MSEDLNPLLAQANSFENKTLKRANWIFCSALFISFVGFIFFVVPIFFLQTQSQTGSIDVVNTTPENTKANIRNGEIKNTLFINAVILCVICGVFLEITALTIFYFYGKILDQLDMNKRLMFANSICEQLTGDFKQKAQIKLIEYLTMYEFEDQEQISEPIKNTKNRKPKEENSN